MEITGDLVIRIKRDIRVKSQEADGEIRDLICAAVQNLKLSGVAVTRGIDPLVYHAIKLYVKANYGYDEDTERFMRAYEAIRDSMALSGDYTEVNNGR